MASAESELITGSGAVPPAGSRGRAPGQGVRGEAPPPEAEHFFCVVIRLKWRKAAMFMSCFIQCDRAMAAASVSICVTQQFQREDDQTNRHTKPTDLQTVQ